jgi:hypothetical protein
MGACVDLIFFLILPFSFLQQRRRCCPWIVAVSRQRRSIKGSVLFICKLPRILFRLHAQHDDMHPYLSCSFALYTLHNRLQHLSILTTIGMSLSSMLTHFLPRHAATHNSTFMRFLAGCRHAKLQGWCCIAATIFDTSCGQQCCWRPLTIRDGQNRARCRRACPGPEHAYEARKHGRAHAGNMPSICS